MWGSLNLKRSPLKGKGCSHVWHIWSMWGCSECLTLTFNVLSARKHSRVQHNSRLSPLPSPRHHEVPTEVSVFLVHLWWTISHTHKVMPSYESHYGHCVMLPFTQREPLCYPVEFSNKYLCYTESFSPECFKTTLLPLTVDQNTHQHVYFAIVHMHPIHTYSLKQCHNYPQVFQNSTGYLQVTPT